MRGAFVGVVEGDRLDDLAAMMSKLNGRRVYRASRDRLGINIQVQHRCAVPGLATDVDFRQSVYYIEAANPKRVLTYGSNSEIFAREPVKTGIQCRTVQDRDRFAGTG